MPLELKIDREHLECRTVDLGDVLDAAKARGVRRLVLTIGSVHIEAEFGEPPLVPFELPEPSEDTVPEDDICAAHSGVSIPSREEIDLMRRKRGGF
jgi:hypothetical protein